jgi:8-oxo-dGTP diphosphatase
MIQVTAAIIQRKNRYLIAQRRSDGKLPLKWEFPGGKVDPGETLEECLARELHEEFGVRATVKNFICQNQHKYEHMAVEVNFYEVELLDQELQLNDHADIAWVHWDEIAQYDLVEADKDVVAQLRTLFKH